MKTIQKIATGFSVLLTDIVLLSCCLYLLVCFGRLSSIQVSTGLWIGLVFISYVVNVFFVKREARVAPFAVWNLAWMSVTCALVAFTFECNPEKLYLTVVVCACVVGIEAHSCYEALVTQKIENCLLFLDGLAIAFILFLTGCRYNPPGSGKLLVGLGFVNMAYLVIVLIILRTTRGNRRVVAGNASSNRRKVFGLLTVVIAACAFISIVLFNTMRNAAFGTKNLLLAIVYGLRGLLYLIEDFCRWIFTLFGVKHADPVPKESYDWEHLTGTLPIPESFWEVFFLFCAAVFVVFVILKNRGLKRQEKDPKKKYVLIEKEQYKTKKQGFLATLLTKILLKLKMYRYRKTPEGLLALALKKGKAVGVTMAEEDSWQGYLLKLAPFGETEIIQELALYMERYFYREVPLEFSRAQYQKFSRCLKKIRREEKNKSDAVLPFHV